MAFTGRNKGMDLWTKATFNEYAFCICCKSEVAPGEEGLESKRGSGDKKDFMLLNNTLGRTWKSKLCISCYLEWKGAEFEIALCELKRFKK